jgi:hypothetical protein
MTPGYGAVAVAIPGPVGKIPLAIGAGGPIERIEAKFDVILAALQQCKAQLERNVDKESQETSDGEPTPGSTASADISTVASD